MMPQCSWSQALPFPRHGWFARWAPANTRLLHHLLCSPQGKTCAGGTAAPADCAADSANPFLGQAAGACKACNHDSTKFTSEAGAAYCSLPFSDRLCNEAPYTAGGWAWDEHAGACTKCRPGTYRSTAMLADGTPDCQEW